MFNPDGKSPIPVGASAREALALPFEYFERFVRLATVPLLITLAAQFASGYLATLTAHVSFYLLWWPIFWIGAVPLSVGWTRLAVLGSTATSDSSWFSFGERELKYLAFSLGVTLSLVGPAALCVYISYTLAWPIWLLVLAAAIGLAEIVIGLRFTFILPAIALDNFQGLKFAWRQTRSTVLRIMAVIALSSLPINCGTSIVRRAESSTKQIQALLILGLAELLLMFLSLVVINGAVAICYRFRMSSQSMGLPFRRDAAPVRE